MSVLSLRKSAEAGSELIEMTEVAVRVVIEPGEFPGSGVSGVRHAIMRHAIMQLRLS